MTRFALPLGLMLLLSTAGCRHRHYSDVVYLKPAPVVVASDPEVVVVAEPKPEPVPFDRAALSAALANIDLDTCRKEGAPHAIVHATLTYVPAGNVSRVTIDRPAGLSVPALACIGRELGEAKVPAFDGASVQVSRSFMIH